MTGLPRAWILVAAALTVPAAAQDPSTGSGQAYPSGPVRFVVPLPAGGTMDIIARTVGQPLARALGQNVIVDNRPGGGGGGIIGTEVVARAPADGYTVLFIGNGFAMNPALRAKLPYDTERDFAGVARVASNPLVISVHPSLPVKSLKELVALARARPGELTAAYLRGQRKPYVGPVPLFLMANVLFFATEALLGGQVFNTPLSSHLRTQPWSPLAATLVTQRLADLDTTLALYAPVFDSAVALHARSLIILMALSFAPLPWIVFARRGKPAATHASAAGSRRSSRGSPRTSSAASAC